MFEQMITHLLSPFDFVCAQIVAEHPWQLSLFTSQQENSLKHTLPLLKYQTQTTGVLLLTVSVISVATGTWFLRIHLTQNPLCHVAFVIKEVGVILFYSNTFVYRGKSNYLNSCLIMCIEFSHRLIDAIISDYYSLLLILGLNLNIIDICWCYRHEWSLKLCSFTFQSIRLNKEIPLTCIEGRNWNIPDLLFWLWRLKNNTLTNILALQQQLLHTSFLQKMSFVIYVLLLYS